MMKFKHILMISIMILFAFMNCTSVTWEGPIPVQTSGKTVKHIITDSSLYKVAVFNGFVAPESNGYHIYFNILCEDTVLIRSVGWGTEGMYNEAFYKWENDSLVSIRLHNSKTNEEEYFQAWGFKKGSGLKFN